MMGFDCDLMGFDRIRWHLIGSKQGDATDCLQTWLNEVV